jgi:hypothetical protein
VKTEHTQYILAGALSIGTPMIARISGVISLGARLGWVILGLVCFCFLLECPALAQSQAPQKAAGGTLTLGSAEIQKPWTGDLDGMIEGSFAC